VYYRRGEGVRGRRGRDQNREEETEWEGNITSKLGYANAKIWRCSNAVGIEEG